MNTQANTEPGRRGNGETRWQSEPGQADLNEHIEHHRAEIDRTLSSLEGKLSPTDLINEALRSLNGGPGQFVNNLGATVRDNPIPATLIGVGLGWLMLGQGDGTGKLREKLAATGSSNDTDSHATADPSGVHGDGIDDMSLTDLYAFCLSREYPFDVDELECVLCEDLGEQAATEYRSGVGAFEETGTASGGSGLAEKGREARDNAKARMDRTRLRMAAGSDEVRSRVAEARRNAMRRAKNASSAVSEGAQRAAAGTGDAAQRYPLAVLALGVAAGAALGAGLPSTQTEDRLIGDTSDGVKKQADEMARGKADAAKRAAKAATTAAGQEAREQGLDRDSLLASGQAVQEKAREAAKQESGSPA